MTNEISVLLVGIGGYGGLYVSALLDAPRSHNLRIAAAVDPYPEKCARLADLRTRGIPIYSSLEEFYAMGRADLAVISSPIHLHCRQTCFALAHGSHVLCEKPLGATIEQAHEMIRARDEAGKVVAIGYQWSFSAAIQELKRDIMAGRFGAPRRLRTIVLWPRDEKYYGRNRWAGAKQDEKGNWILDSPVNNAASHYLHNMFYVLGERTDRSAWPIKVSAELYRAHAIRNYDTGVLRCVTENGAQIFFAASHATQGRRGPVFCYEFERGTVRYDYDAGREIVAEFANGSRKNYGSPDGDSARKLWEALGAIREGRPVVCGLEAASAQTACMWGAQQSVSDIPQFPDSLVHVEGEPGSRKTWVAGLDADLNRCYDLWRLPAELGASWAKQGKEVDTFKYRPSRG